MPAAILIGGLVAIAFAFAAIAAALLIENLVIGPLDSAAAAVSETAVIGGVLAWALTSLANFIRYSLAGVKALVGTAEQQAADWWNYLTYQSTLAQFSYWWGELAWLVAQGGQIVWLETYMPALRSYVVNSLQPTVMYLNSVLSGLLSYVQNNLVPWVAHIQADLDFMRSSVFGTLFPWVQGIGDDLANLHRWIDVNVARRSELAQAEQAISARIGALAATTAIAITAIEDSPCMKMCEPLGDLGTIIQGLEDAGLFAIFLSLIDEARTNPEALESMFSDTIAPIARDIASSLQLGIPD